MDIEKLAGGRDWIIARLGSRCFVCGKFIMIQSELSLKWCEPTCIYCEDTNFKQKATKG